MKRTESGLIATSFRTLGTVGVYRPRSIAQAVQILAESDEPPVMLAGGTDLVAQFNEGRAPRHVLALAGISELNRIALDNGNLQIGAMTTHAAGSLDPLVRRAAPGFADAWARIANVRVRFSATLGGNVMASRTRYEMPILLAALHARIDTEGGTADRSLLTNASVSADGLVAFDYDRTLRPIMTLALCIRREADALTARAVLGTENMSPFVLDFALKHNDITRLAADALETARNAFAGLPDNIRDNATSNAYLRGAGTALLARQLARVAHAAA